MESRVLGQEQGFAREFVEFFFAVRSAGIDVFGDVPVKVRAGSDHIAVHGPVVILAEGETVGGVVVA